MVIIITGENQNTATITYGEKTTDSGRRSTITKKDF